MFKNLKPNKSCGFDRIPNEVIKNEHVILHIWEFFKIWFDTGFMSSVWLKAIVTPIPKGATVDPYVSLNYCGISLLSCVTILFIYLGFCVAFNTVQVISSWKGRGNQYIQFVRVLYCKLPTNSKQLPAFPLEAMLGTRTPASEVGGHHSPQVVSQKHILNNRLSRYFKEMNLFTDEQNGKYKMQKRRSCNDHIFTLYRLIKMTIQTHKSVYAAFIDLEKTFDKVNQELLF